MTDLYHESSNMTAEWVTRQLAKNPCVVMNDGNIRTCLARLSFPVLTDQQFEQAKKNRLAKGLDGEQKRSATLLFPPGADLGVLKDAGSDTAKERWPNAAELIKNGGLHSPFRDQREKMQFEGYIAGGVFVTCTSDRSPMVTDVRGAPVVRTEDLHPGIWVFGIVRPFAFDVKMKKGISFGLQGIIKIGEDKELGGGGVDIGAAVAGIDIDAADVPDQMFGTTSSASADEKSLFA